MTKITSIAAVIVVAAWQNNFAVGQTAYPAYFGPGTAFSAGMFGMGAYAQGVGNYLVLEAQAGLIWEETLAKRDERRIDRYYWSIEKKELREQLIAEKYARNWARREAQAAVQREQAMQLWESAQQSGVLWPAALYRTEYASAVASIESLLRQWSTEAASDDSYRRALANEAAALRRQVAANRTALSFAERLAAVRALKLVQRLATMNCLGSGAQQLAMQ